MIDTKETIYKDIYTSVFCGLGNTREFKIDNKEAGDIINELNSLAIRNVSLETDNCTLMVCFTTGIDIKKGFDKNQV